MLSGNCAVNFFKADFNHVTDLFEVISKRPALCTSLIQVNAGTLEAVEFLSLTNSSSLTPIAKFSELVLMYGLIVSTNFKPVWLKWIN